MAENNEDIDIPPPPPMVRVEARVFYDEEFPNQAPNPIPDNLDAHIIDDEKSENFSVIAGFNSKSKSKPKSKSKSNRKPKRKSKSKSKRNPKRKSKSKSKRNPKRKSKSKRKSK